MILMATQGVGDTRFRGYDGEGRLFAGMTALASSVLKPRAQNEFGFEHGATPPRRRGFDAPAVPAREWRRDSYLRSWHFARQARAVAKRMFELLRPGF